MRRILSAILALFMAMSVAVSAFAGTVKHTCKTYQLSPADQLVLQKKADEFLDAMQAASSSNEEEKWVTIQVPGYLLRKYDTKVLSPLIVDTAMQQADFINGRYALSQFSLRYFVPSEKNGCGYIFRKLLSAEQMQQTESIAKSMVQDLDQKSMPEKTKIREIYNRLEKSMSYDEDFGKTKNEISETAYGALVRHTAVCCGASMAMSLLCHYAGITNFAMCNGALVVNGQYGGHAWNTWTNGNKTYLIDVVNHRCLKESVPGRTYLPNVSGSTYRMIE